jgi:hypothetical protein
MLVLDAAYYREQAWRFDRAADQYTIPAVILYYRQLAIEHRAVAGKLVLAQLDPRPARIG